MHDFKPGVAPMIKTAFILATLIVSNPFASADGQPIVDVTAIVNDVKDADENENANDEVAKDPLNPKARTACRPESPSRRSAESCRPSEASSREGISGLFEADRQ